MIDIRWRKSSKSNLNGQCVELSNTLTHLRDSKNATGPTLRGNVVALVAAVKDGRLHR
jgi:hypothetical protein